MVGYDEHKPQLTSIQHMLAGASSGVISRVTVQPLDVVKIRFQIQTEPNIKTPVSSKASFKYRGILQALTLIAKEEGVQALWKGHVPAQLLSISYGCVQLVVSNIFHFASQALCLLEIKTSVGDLLMLFQATGQARSRFTSFEALTKVAYWTIVPHDKYDLLKPATHFVCGGLAGCCASLVVQPIDVLRTRLVAQGEPKVYNGLTQAVISMYQENGCRTFYKGLLPTMLEIFPQTGMQFAFYTGLQMIWNSHINTMVDSNISASESLFCGALSGIFSKIIIHPLDVVKKRLQIQGFAFREREAQNVLLTSSSGGMINCIKNILRVEGISGFYKGLKVNIVKGASSAGVTFLAYEQCCKYMLDN